MLPVWYTAFRETTVTGVPILRRQYVVFPKDKNGFDMDDQYYIGSSGLLVKPITEKDVTDDQIYYDYFSFATHRGAPKGKHITVPAALHQIPLLIRGGSIVSTRERPRRASSRMAYDPFTLRVALSRDDSATGDLYLDDGETYSHQQGQYVWRQFVADAEKTKKGGKSIRISSIDLGKIKPTEAVEGAPALTTYDPKNAYAKTLDERNVRVEKFIVLGLKNKPKSVKVEGTGEELVWDYIPGAGSAEKKGGMASTLIMQDPKLKITSDWSVVIS